MVYAKRVGLMMVFAVAATSCGKKDKDDKSDGSDDGSVYGSGQGGDEERVGVVGTIAISDSLRLLEGETDTIVAVPLGEDGGANAATLRDEAVVVTVEEDGSFTVPVPV